MFKYIKDRFVERVIRNNEGFLNFLIPAAMGIGSMVAGGIGASKANAEAYRRNMARATGIKYSPWTGYRPGEKAEGQSVLGGVLGGGLQGAMSGMSLTNALGVGGQGGSFSPYGGGGNQPQLTNYNYNQDPRQFWGM